MSNTRISISMAHMTPQIVEKVEETIGRGRIFNQGTDDRLFAEFYRRDLAGLAVINLNLIHGVKAEIMERYA